MNADMKKQLLELLLSKAGDEPTLWDRAANGEDICVYDIWGSNVDDAYEGGMDDGEQQLAEALLHKFGEWLKNAD